MKQLANVTLIICFVSIAGYAHAEQRGRHGPPPGAIEACEGLDADAACTVETPRGTVEGVCGRRQASEELHCIPGDPPPRRGHHGPPPGAIEACEGLDADAVCTVETPRGTVEGVCGRRQASEEIHCIPNGPPPRRER